MLKRLTAAILRLGKLLGAWMDSLLEHFPPSKRGVAATCRLGERPRMSMARHSDFSLHGGQGLNHGGPKRETHTPLKPPNHDLPQSYPQRLLLLPPPPIQRPYHIAVTTYRGRTTLPHLPSSLISHSIQRNPLWPSLTPHLTPLNTNILTVPQHIFVVGRPIKTTASLPPTLLNTFHHIDLTNLQQHSTSRTGRLLPIPKRGKPHTIIAASTFLPRHHQRPLIHWLLGVIASHQTCTKCVPDTEVSRAHAIQCANIPALLSPLFPNIQPLPLPGATILDTAISSLHFNAANIPKIRLVVNSIETIRTTLLGQTRTHDILYNSTAEENNPVAGRGLHPWGPRPSPTPPGHSSNQSALAANSGI
ncbi:hypothetical protein BC829DRAFT_442882 [Chytridium lagenaria]|nr:hypothetical protein BC829DRAFT_442882 [Chytridium lagenaria]